MSADPSAPTPHREPRLAPAAFLEKWQGSAGAERANAQLFLHDLAAVLGVPAPQPTTGDARHDPYVFERPLAFQDGTKARGFIDLYKRGHFVLETKQGADHKRTAAGRTLRQGHGIRGTAGWHATMDAARHQAEGYAKNLEAAEPVPPFVVVCDVGYCVDLYADFSGIGRLYQPFPDAGTHRLPLDALCADTDDGAELRARLAAVWTDPLALDPARRQARVTVALAKTLAGLADALAPDGTATDAAGQPMDAEAVAAFLSQCLFAMFAEDAGLIPERAFTSLLLHYADNLPRLPRALDAFFGAMDRGDYLPVVDAEMPRFNGLLFKSSRAPRLSPEAHQMLLDAARADWADVEPSIFGTLLERALDPAERHRLGAHFTPRAYVERLVGPAVLEPLRDRWRGVRAEAETLAEKAGQARRQADVTRYRNQARAVLRAFLSELAAVTVLDPACGSGNFLYVTFAGLKALEDEARRAAERLVGEAVAEGLGVQPTQMRGIELNARAAAIADLVLWIGHLQWHRQHGHGRTLTEPILDGYGQVEHRDALLQPADADGYRNPAAWPQADFIVGNPPFIGASRMRDALGDAYTERLRDAYDDVPESADFVMYWWDRAAFAVREGRARRFGFITTNSISQTFNRRVLGRHLNGIGVDFREYGDEDRSEGGKVIAYDAPNPGPPLALAFAIPDHPWVDTADGADVRVAMTVGASSETFDADAARLVTVTDESRHDQYGVADVETETHTGRINIDLTVGADVTQAESLKANADLSNPGVKLHGAGFIVKPEKAKALGLGRIDGLERHIRAYRNGRDLMATPRGVLVIDLFGLDEAEARERFPEVYEHLLREVKPDRDKNRRKSRRENWWLFGETNPKLRRQLDGLPRYIATVETAKHRLFQFLDASILPDNMLVAVALDDAFHLGVLSSAIHVEWALAAGARLGIGNDPRYTKSKCFEPFPFPDASPEQAEEIRALGEAIDAHRKARQAAHPTLGLTDLYNAVAALRAGRPLTPKEQTAADRGLAHTLVELHRRLDAAVLRAYAWTDLAAERPDFRAAVLARLVALNAARRAEEAAGHVRHLRPAFQAPAAAPQSALALPAAAAPEAAAPRRPWPDTFAERITAVAQAAAAGLRTDAALHAHFDGASPAALAEARAAAQDQGLA